jgi:dihydrofolate reductase
MAAPQCAAMSDETTRPLLALIAAVARNGVIGRADTLPWHLPEDLRHFRETTLGHAVIMGRRTWESLPPKVRPLPGRRNLVLTRQPGWQAAGAEAVPTLAAALALLQGQPRAFVIGGAGVYAAALPLADELVLTEIHRDFEGDVHFPPFDRAAFVEAERLPQQAVAPNGLAFDFVTYRRR